jgi:hypothetical protein
MPILGILASAITGNLVTNSYESIATVTVGSGGAADVTFSSIPSTYTHLQIRASSAQASANWATLNFNSDTGANYAGHFLIGNGSTASTYSFTSNVAPLNFYSGTGSVFGAAILDILDYANTNKYKTVRSLNGYDANGSGQLQLASNLWMNTGAVTSIKLTPNSPNFSQYSSFALYGIKGA